MKASAQPLVIAHRGASGARPEHAWPAYALALEQGADVLEPDLVMSADGVLVVRHDLGLRRSTDVAARAEACLGRTLAADEDPQVLDWPWEQLQRLGTIQPMAQRLQTLNGLYPILSFEMLLERAAAEARRRERRIVLYPEIKHPQAHLARGLDPVQALVALWERRRDLWTELDLWVQCFDFGTLQRLRRLHPFACAWLCEEWPAEPAALLPTIQALAPCKQLLLDDLRLGARRVSAAQACGLAVHAWTFRDDVADAQGRSGAALLRLAYGIGVDAVFTDHPATAIAIREEPRA